MFVALDFNGNRIFGLVFSDCFQCGVDGLVAFVVVAIECFHAKGIANDKCPQLSDDQSFALADIIPSDGYSIVFCERYKVVEQGVVTGQNALQPVDVLDVFQRLAVDVDIGVDKLASLK